MRKASAIAALSWLSLSFGIAGCERGISVDRVQSSLGQPVGDYPNYDERVALYATNRARVDPTAEGWPAYPAQPPMQWQVDLNRSARAHSLDMRDTPCFQHNSCDGTDAFVRVKTFYTGPWTSLGENISAGQSVSDGFIAVHNWLYEIGATPGETGHRDNIFSAKFTLVGNGFVPGGTKFQNYWTQDFVGTTVTRPRMGDGIHFPSAPAAAGAPVTFGTTYFDAGGAAPSRVAVVVDGTCSALTLARGTAARGAYEAKLSLGAGCYSYFFLATTASTTATYPDVGALQVGVAVAAAACPLAAAVRAGNGCAGGADAGSPTDGSGKGSGGSNGQGDGAGSGGAGSGDDGAGASAGAGGSDQGGAAGTNDPGGGGSSSGGGQPGNGGEGGAVDTDAGVAPIPAPAGRDDINGSAFGCAVAAADRAVAGGDAAAAFVVFAVIAGAFSRSSRRGRQPVRRSR
ncbi:MAG: hypothetical protein QOI66_4840 [Myxococcales bacterium]|nr:hypothetical protein [Myxococcales bacterium]